MEPSVSRVQNLGILGYIRCEVNGAIEQANATIAQWLGVDSPELLKGKNLETFLHDASLLPSLMSQDSPFTCRFELQARDGRQLPVKAEICHAKPGRLELWIIGDMADELIARVARLEASLTFTAGTVHDVNNVMTVLSGNLFLLTESVRDRPKLLELARRARNAATRGSTLLRELLTFNRNSDGEAKAMTPGDHVEALQPLLLRAILAAGAKHELKVNVSKDAGSTIASAAQFESALINLVINARDALKRRGKVCIEVTGVNVDPFRAEQLMVTPGHYVCTSVTDDGSGIPAHLLKHVTEPLFSTKMAERGSGLGLAMVKHFAETARGTLTIESAEGRGTKVRIYLPCTEKLAETTANMTLPLSTLPGGSESIVLLTGDREVRMSVQQILEVLGYTVLAVEGAEEVERAMLRSPAPSLVITERSSHAVASDWRWLDDLKKTHADVRHVVLLEAGVVADETAPDSHGHVYRPVNVAELARTVRNVLEKT